MVTRLLTICLILFSTPLLAADITVRTDRDTVGLDEPFRLFFIVEGKQDGEPDFSPLNKDFQLLGTSTSSSFNMINGNISQSKTYTLTVAARQKGRLSIPPIHFGKDASPARVITVTDAPSAGSQAAPQPVPPGGPPGNPLAKQAAGNDQLFVRAEVDEKTPYVQQQVILTLKIYRRIDWRGASLSDPSFSGDAPLMQPLGKERNYEETVNGKRYVVTELRYALFPQQSGELRINPFTLTAQVADATKKRSRSPFGGAFDDPFFDDFFNQRSYRNITARTNTIALDVKPVPPSFTGRHWLPARNITLQQTWSGDITDVKTGEPVTRTIAIIADGLTAGQLPEVPMESSNQAKVYPDQAETSEQDSKQGMLSTRSQKFAVIPAQPGKLDMPVIEIPWWNTETDKQEIARLDAATLQASGAGLAPAPPVQAAQSAQPVQSTTPAPVTDTADETAKLPVSSDALVDSVSNRWLVAANVTLLVLWLITLFLWWRGRRMHEPAPAGKPAAANNQNRKQALKQLQLACKHHDASATRDALLDWAKAIWPEEPPTSLNEIGRRVDDVLAAEIDWLSQSLYGSQSAQWDGEAIVQQVSRFRVDRSVMEDGGAIEPLYR